MDTLKHHHVKFKQAPAWDETADWEARIKEIKGVSQVRIDPDNGDIFVQYDILQCREVDIERWMVEAGLYWMTVSKKGQEGVGPFYRRE